MGRSARSNIIPDLLVRMKAKRVGDPDTRYLFDLKTIQLQSPTHYHQSFFTRADGATDYLPQFAQAVANREKKVQADYLRHAKAIERKLDMGRDANGVGPVQREMARYQLRGLVVGAHGEVSPTLKMLLGRIAKGLAETYWRKQNFDSAQEAMGVMLQKVKREFAAVATTATARVIIDRATRAESSERAHWGYSGEIPRAEERFYHQADWHGPRRPV